MYTFIYYSLESNTQAKDKKKTAIQVPHDTSLSAKYHSSSIAFCLPLPRSKFLRGKATVTCSDQNHCVYNPNSSSHTGKDQILTATRFSEMNVLWQKHPVFNCKHLISKRY